MRLESDGLFVLISGVTSEADALFAVALGANGVSFDFGPTERQVSVALAHDILRRLPPSVVTVGVFHSEMPERVVEIANGLGLAAVQLDGVTSTLAKRYVAERVRCVIRAVSSPEEAYAHDTDASIDYLMVPDGDDPDGLRHFEGYFADPLVFRPVIAQGLGPENVAHYVGSFDLFGVAALGAIESSPGVKDAVNMGQFIARARESAQPRSDGAMGPDA